MLLIRKMASQIWDSFHRVAADRRDRVAIYGLSESRTATFDAVADDAAMLRTALSKHLSATPCVVSAIGNRVAFIPFLVAAASIDAAIALLDADTPRADVEAIADRLGAEGIVMPTEAAVAKRLTDQPLAAGLSVIRRAISPRAQWTHSGSAPVILKMTSGSSDRPRAVLASETNLIEDARQISEAMTITPADVNLAAIPLSHSYGMGNLVMPLLVQGSPIALRDRFLPRDIQSDVRSCGVTTFAGVPYMFEHLRRQGLASSVAGVRLLVTAGAPMPHDTVVFYQQATGRKIHSFYGTSETGGISYDATDDVSEIATVGRPMPRTSVTLWPAPNAAAGTGRVFVRGAAVASGYAGGQSDEGLSVFVDGGFLTGDLASLDECGRLRLAGRVSRFINVAGRKVDPGEVESVLRSAAHVLEAAVIGMRCDTRGEQIVACVRRRDRSVSTADLRAYCARHLAAHKVPRQIVFVEGLPVDQRGKLDRPAIERLIGEMTPYNAVSVQSRMEDE